MQRKLKTQRKKENAERRGQTNGTSHGREVANETNYRREKKEKKRGRGGLNKNSIGRMCYNEEEINRKEEAEMKREDVGTKDESCWGVVIHTLVSF